MKSDYESRALKTIALLLALFDGCESLDDFTYAIDWYNLTHSRQLKYAHGVSRFAIIRADYVIKFDMTPGEGWESGIAGNNTSEARVYNRAVKDGMAHLLAKPTVVDMGGRTITIMPRISGVNDEERYWVSYCTNEEREWLNSHVGDLHEGNVGYRNGKVCVIDYAWEDE